METRFIATAGWTLEVEHDLIDVSTDYPTPDERWRYTDDAGHEHHYDHGYPTLELVVDEEHWCDGNEGFMPHDPHQHIDAAHYECRECRQVIKPREHVGGIVRQMEAGPMRAWLSGPRPEGVQATVRLTDDEFEELRASAFAGDESARDTVALRILSEAPPARITKMEFTSGI